MSRQHPSYSIPRYLAAWAVHLFTASAAFVGVMTIALIFQNDYVNALWLMGLAVFIDAIDGSLARLVHVKSVLPSIDGTLLDNIVDYLNYVITPCVFLYVKPDMLPGEWSLIIIAAVTLTSAYQFTQADAKTPDHFFKGFPCYWNIALFYMFILNTGMWTNLIILTVLSIMIFIPIKYVYPSRLDYLTDSFVLKVVYHSCSIVYAISAIFLLLEYPVRSTLWLSLSIAYVVMYLSLSIYRTYSPMIKEKITARKQGENR